MRTHMRTYVQIHTYRRRPDPDNLLGRPALFILGRSAVINSICTHIQEAPRPKQPLGRPACASGGCAGGATPASSSPSLQHTTESENVDTLVQIHEGSWVLRCDAACASGGCTGACSSSSPIVTSADEIVAQGNVYQQVRRTKPLP
jgi:hypothetical protein